MCIRDRSRRRRAVPPPPQRRAAASGREAGGGSDAVVLAENVPAEQDPNIARSTDGYRANDPVMASGRTRSMADRFLQQQEHDAASPPAAGDRSSGKPAWLIELENAKETEYGVFENEPEVRVTRRRVCRLQLLFRRAQCLGRLARA